MKCSIFSRVKLLHKCKNRCVHGIATIFFKKNLGSLILYSTFALGNKCKIYESDKLMSQIKGEMSHT